MKMEQPVPDEVTVIVHSAKGLQGKKPGRHKYSVIFGFGSKKYRTSIVKNPGGNPEWNEESIIKVNNTSDHIFLNVTEKEDILGQVLVPLSSLRDSKGRVVRTALQPHKKNAKPHGDLIYQCYISKFCASSDIEDDANKSNTSNNWLKTNPFVTLSRSPRFARKFFKKDRKSNMLSTFNKKISRSLHDIFNVGKGDLSDDEEPETKSRAFRLKAVSTFTLDCVGTEPEITYITPNKGSTSGGTRITVVGDYLGLDKNDIVTLSISNVDCMSTLEYESPRQIYCTTLPGPVGQGNFVIETMSGGVTVLTGGFLYEPIVRSKKAPAPTPPKTHMSQATDTPMTSALRRNAASTPDLMAAQCLEPPSPEVPVKSKEKMLESKHMSVPSPTPTRLTNETTLPPKTAPRSATLNRTPEKKVSQEPKKAFTLGRTSDKILSQAETVSPKKSPEKNHKTQLKEIKQNGTSSKEDSPKTENVEGRFKKNFLKHLRHTQETPPAIETIVIENGVSECEESSTEEDFWTEKAKLAELERLQEENRDLKQENADMKAYIDKLLAKVLIHCPDALSADGDLSPPK